MFRITEDPSSGSLYSACLKITRMILSCRIRIRCHNTDHVHVNGHDRTIIVILAKYCIRLPDDGSFVIRNMLEQNLNIFKYCVIILIVSTNYVCASVG